MIPNNAMAPEAHFSAFQEAMRQPNDLLIDYEMGGVALQDGSQGLLVQQWQIRLLTEDNPSDPNSSIYSIQLKAANAPNWQTVFVRTLVVTELALAFDNNMNPFIAFVENHVPIIWYFDTLTSSMTFRTMPTDMRNPRCCTDDKRTLETSLSDVVLAYLRGTTLCVRYQRERYVTEHVLQTGIGSDAKLVSVGMNNGWRLQFRLRGNVPLANAKIQVDPFLGDIVQDLCLRAGIPAESIDVSELYEDTVPGYMLNQDDGVDTYLKPLSQVFFFDPTEYDRVLHFYKRGRDVVMGISYKDLVATGNASKPMKKTVRDKTKLPKTVNVSYLDPTGGYATNKQYAERKSNLITATGNENIDTPIVLQPDQAATFALQTLKAEWHELMDYAWSLPIGYSVLVPGDVFDFFDDDGSTQRIRITSKNEDENVLKFEGEQDGGPDVYDSKATGLALPYPDSTTPGLLGDTRLEILNIPALRDQDDELGIYVGYAGDTSAWYGASILFSTDGVNYVEATRGEIPATLGETTTELLAEVSSEYLSDQSVIVTSNFDLESVTEDELLNNQNRIVIGDEVLQYTTATFLGTNLWRLSGLVRGRYNTDPVHWPAGTRFIVIDTSITFIQAQQWMLGMELWFKPVSYGLTDDESTPTTYEFDLAYSQWEWAPVDVAATRDGSNNVAVVWTPRPRLGIEISPHQSKYFAGYRVVFSDGFAAVLGTSDVAYTRNACPTGLTVHVVGINSITGDGEHSEEVAT